jgi:hypothetical protein
MCADRLLSVRTIKRKAAATAAYSSAALKKLVTYEAKALHTDYQSSSDSDSGSDNDLHEDYDSDDSDASLSDIKSQGDHEDNQLIAHLADWVVSAGVTQKDTDRLLSILQPHLPFLPKSRKGLLSSNPLPQTSVMKISNGEFHHIGLKKSIQMKIETSEHLQQSPTISLQFNVDGLPLFKSSSFTLWPILGMIREEAKPVPFVISVWVGPGKPKDSDQLLQPFVKEMKHLLEEGIEFHGKPINIKVTNIICDMPARSFIKKTKGHTGYSGCDFCVQTGDYVRRRVTFPRVDAPLRTDTSFSAMVDDDHHKGESVLMSLGIGMVSQIPPDYMHLMCLGVMRKLLGVWLGTGPVAYRLGTVGVQKVSKRITKLRPTIPKEFNRKGRSLSEVDRWKATEFRLILLYTGPHVLKDILNTESYQHFLLFHGAVRILCANGACPAKLDYAQELLEKFVVLFGQMYGEEMLIYNVHCLLHIVHFVKLYGPLDNFSSFPYENYLKTLKRTIKKPQYIVQQIVNRLSEQNAITPPTSQSSSTRVNNPDDLECIPQSFKSFKPYKQVHTPKFMLSTTSPDNAILYNDDVYTVEKILHRKKTHKTYLGCRKFCSRESFFMYPFDSLKMDIAVVQKPNRTLKYILIDNVHIKVLLLPYRTGHLAIPLLHHL